MIYFLTYLVFILLPGYLRLGLSYLTYYVLVGTGLFCFCLLLTHLTDTLNLHSLFSDSSLPAKFR